MKKLDTSPITTTAGFKFKSGTFDFLQLAYQECITELMTSRIGPFYDATKGYILNGCVNTGSGSNYIISAGSVFSNGEIFLCDAQTFTLSGSQVAEAVITITQYTTNADAVTFTNGTPYNVHDIRKIVFQGALSGSGAFDYINAVNLANKPIGGIGQSVMWIMPGSGSQASLLATYFSPTTPYNGIHPLTFGWQIDTSVSAFVPAGYNPAGGPYGTLEGTQGEDEYTIQATDLPELFTNPKFASGEGSPATAYQEISATSAADTETVNAGSPNNPISLIQSTKNKLYIRRFA